jgi:peptide/nickel transport system permease protein
MQAHATGAWTPIWNRLRRDRLALIAGAFVMALILLALLAPVLPIRDPNHGYYDLLPANGQPIGPSPSFLLGSDSNGRDLLSRIIWGSRVSLFIGFVANGVALLVGLFVGTVSGYFGRWVDMVLMRITDVMMAFPVLLFSIALIAVIPRGNNVLVIAAVIALFYWTAVARIVRGQVLSLKGKEFIEAARATGATPRRILLRHIFPHLLPVLIVYGTIGIATSISTESILSFIGIGVQPPTPDWGKMVSDGQSYFAIAPWLVLFPGLMILLTVLSFNLVGDGLRDALDPRRALSRGYLGGVASGGQAMATGVRAGLDTRTAETVAGR